MVRYLMSQLSTLSPIRSSTFGAVILLAAGALSSSGLSAETKPLEGTIRIDGSSTVFPITEAVAEEFQKENKKVRVTVGISGTGGGFKKFTTGETAISNASRPIKASEAAAAKANKIDFIELPIAYDGLAVVVNPKNTFVKSITKAELKKIWEPGSKVKTWNEVNPAWPNQPIKLYGPGTDSGTFDYFTEEINGEAKKSRSDFTASEDDNVLVTGIAGDANALGYFGYGYYLENKKRLRDLPIDGGKGPISPNDKTVSDRTYPLSRPLFIYVSTKDASRPEVDAFVRFFLKNAAALSHEIGYTPLAQKVYEEALKRFEAKKTGSWQASN